MTAGLSFFHAGLLAAAHSEELRLSYAGLDPGHVGWQVFLLVLFILINGFFVAAEFALVKVRGSQLDPLVEEGKGGAKLTRHITSHLDAYLSACQLGITIGDSNFWGKGYGSEAISLLLDYAFRYRNLRRVWLKVHGQNQRAQRTYRRLGFIKEGELRSHVYSNGSYDSLLLMGILRSEWKEVR